MQTVVVKQVRYVEAGEQQRSTSDINARSLTSNEAGVCGAYFVDEPLARAKYAWCKLQIGVLANMLELYALTSAERNVLDMTMA